VSGFLGTEAWMAGHLENGGQEVEKRRCASGALTAQEMMREAVRDNRGRSFG
jgi:hypothetical protein